MTYFHSCPPFPILPPSLILMYHYPALLISVRRDRSLDILIIPQCRLKIPSVLSQAQGSELSIHSCPLPDLLDECVLGVIGRFDRYSVKD